VEISQDNTGGFQRWKKSCRRVSQKFADGMVQRLDAKGDVLGGGHKTLGRERRPKQTALPGFSLTVACQNSAPTASLSRQRLYAAVSKTSDNKEEAYDA
jgi:hypothetical protein